MLLSQGQYIFTLQQYRFPGGQTWLAVAGFWVMLGNVLRTLALFCIQQNCQAILSAAHQCA